MNLIVLDGKKIGKLEERARRIKLFLFTWILEGINYAVGKIAL